MYFALPPSHLLSLISLTLSSYLILYMDFSSCRMYIGANQKVHPPKENLVWTQPHV